MTSFSLPVTENLRSARIPVHRSAPITIQNARGVVTTRDMGSDTTSVEDEVDEIDAPVPTKSVALQVSDGPKNILKRLPSKVRNKIWEYYIIFECSPYVTPRDIFLKTLLPALEISPIIYRDALAYYFDHFMVTITLEVCDSLKYVRPETVALIKNLQICSNPNCWLIPPSEAAKTFMPLPTDYLPIVKYAISPPLQLKHALHLRKLRLSVVEEESVFLSMFFDELLKPTLRPTPLRALHIYILCAIVNPPFEYGGRARRDARKLFKHVEKKMKEMYPKSSELTWDLKRNWTCVEIEGECPDGFAWDKWSLLEGTERLPDGPIIGDTVLADM